MDNQNSAAAVQNRLWGKISLFLSSKAGIIFRFALTGLFISFAVWFFNHQKTELHTVSKVIFNAKPIWIAAGLTIVVIYIILQGLMYVTSFAAVNARLSLPDAIILFLKRNFISVFIPAGGVSSLAFFGQTIEKKGVNRSTIYFASSIYGFVGILSLIIVAVPAFMFAVSGNDGGFNRWPALLGALLILILIYLLYKSIMGKKSAYRLILRIFPGVKEIGRASCRERV